MSTAKNSGGFTLLELLISVAIGSIILLSVVALFQEQGKTYKAQDALILAGQRTRLAIDNFSRELGLAGYGLPVITAVIMADRSPGNTTIYLPNTSGFDNSATIYLCGSGVCEPAVISSTDPQLTTEITISSGLTNSFSAGDTIYTVKDDRTNLTLEGIVDSSYNSQAFNNAYLGSIWGSRNIFSKALDTTENTISFFANIEQLTTPLGKSVTAGATVLLTTENVEPLKAKDLIFISDGGVAESAGVRSASSSTISLAGGGLTNSYPLGSTISNADLITYKYDPATNTLKRGVNGGPLTTFVENIDYFRIRYFDSNQNPLPDPAPNPYTGVSLTPSERAAIRLINVQIVAITDVDDPLFTATGTYENGTTYNDKRHRIALETNIFMRNLVK